MSTTVTAAPLDRGPRTRPLALVVVASPDPSALDIRLPLAGPPTTLGRTDRASVRIDDPRTSGLHAALRPARGDRPPSIADLGSRNGLFVDGATLKSAPLTSGSVVRLGDTCAVVDDGGTLDDPVLRGISAAATGLRAELDKVAGTALTVLLLGETGTGKELAAERVHARSERRGPLVPVNCAAIPTELAEAKLFGHRKGAFTGATDSAPGLFAQANGGTLFLDEVGELSLAIQAKLLRVLEDRRVTPVGGRTARTVEVRVVAATNLDLHAAGTFRADLLARLEEWPVRLPPLRDRRVDVPLLARSFLGERPLYGDAAEALLLHDWPFNVRGLRQLCRRLAVVVPAGTPVAFDDLPEALAERILSRHVEVDPRQAVIDALRASGGNASQAAKALGISRRTLYRRLDELGVDPADHR